LKEIDLLNRTFSFAIRTIKAIRVFPDNTELKVIKYQLIKSATSVGANYEEAQAASSKADFTHKVKTALKEARESNYWLRMLAGLNYNSDELQLLIQESKELKNILGAIVLKLSKES
jgi:four helix bundle protein